MMSRCKNGTRGFTLIELSIVMMLSGLMMASAFSAFSLYMKTQRATESYDKQQVIATSISNYSTKAGRFPCPADPSLPLTDPNAGRELPNVAPTFLCATLKASPDGTCMRFNGSAAAAGTGICKTSGRDTKVDVETVLGDPILIGAIPYVTIKEGIALSEGVNFASGNDSTLPSAPPKDCLVNVPILPAIAGIREYPNPQPPKTSMSDLEYDMETYCDINNDSILDASVRLKPTTANFEDLSLKSVLDPYGYQMTYAITGALTDKSTYHTSYGAISVKTERGVELTSPASSAHYLIAAHGENHMGAFNAWGQVPYPCTTGNVTKDEENCDFDGNFIEGLRSLNTNTPAARAEYFDDTVFHSVVNISSLWEFAPGSPDIFNLNIGNVGIGTDTPLERLHVAGNLRANEVKQDLICNTMGDKCFSADNIGGSPTILTETGVPTGTKCDTSTYPVPAGKMRVVVGIKNGRVKCSSSNPLDPDYDPLFPDPPKAVPTLNQSCPAGQYVQGFKTDGTVLCCVASLPSTNSLSCGYVPP